MFEGFSEAVKAMRESGEGRALIGEKIRVKHAELGELIWEIIGVNADKASEAGAGTLTVQLRSTPIYRQFCEPSKEYPWGFNDWAHSSLRAWLRGKFMDGLSDEDKQAVKVAEKSTWVSRDSKMAVYGETMFLLSASEAGFKPNESTIKNEGCAYALYAGGDDEARRIKDSDGDECFWWLRSPYPGSANGVRDVNPDGTLGSSHANNATAVAPACVIG